MFSFVLAKSKKFTTFDDLMKRRRDEAVRSILVQVNSEKSYEELFNYCSQFGNIKSAFHYQIAKDRNDYILLEFDKIEECRNALNHCAFNPDNSGVPASSRFTWFKAPSFKKVKMASPPEVEAPNLQSHDIKLMSESSLNELLTSTESIDDQIAILYRSTCLNELGSRIRFFMSNQLETSLRGIFPFVKVRPFGSSVNGFGKLGCDLDLVLSTHLDHHIPVNHDTRLIFHTKANLNNERSQLQQHMEVIGDLMHHFLPGISNVRRILQARVPIIKFNHECLDLEVDLSMNALTGIYMSELFYLLGEIDERVRPLTFCVRKWAMAAGITSPSPGRWISNFSLTCLVLFFLQRVKNPILPPVKSLMSTARSEDIRIADNDINCTFLRDLNEMKFRRTNKESVANLLKQFFEFYSQFDFAKRAVSLIEGNDVMKPDHSALWIINVFEQILNVSKNVSFEELERFKLETKNAAWTLESLDDERTSKDMQRGLLKLFKVNKSPVVIKPQMFYKSRLVEVSDLFNEQSGDGINFKNHTTRAAVEAARKATRKSIQKMEMQMKTRQS